ncbi:MAG TPA: class I SAM-dependent methyltransferase [Marmoricola sp.]|nr:class I SAM-dependent methyltransferase [Marmoricola sp.]
MDVSDLVTGHYGSTGIAGRLLTALADTGVDVDRLQPEQLARVDQLHAGFVPATEHLLGRLGVGPGMHLLDVGCGIGGPARLAAARGAEVNGVDLTPAFVDAAKELTARVGLAGKASFDVTSGDRLPFPDESFDAAMMIHVGMNVPDKRAVFAEVRRVLPEGGQFAVYDQMRAGDGELPWPLPWADDERSSFVETAEQYGDHLAASGFTVEVVDDRTETTLAPPPAGAIPPDVLLGPGFGQRLGNNVAATRAGTLVAMLLVARAR